MSKKIKSLFLVLCFMFVLSLSLLVGCKDNKTAKISLTFDNSTEVYEVEENGSVTAPTVTTSAGQELLGWALEANAAKAKFTGNTIKYDQVKSYAKDGSLKLYSVIESKIEVVMKGITDSTTKVSDLTLNTASVPLVEQNERQKFLGWALTEGATEATIAADTSINYNVVKEYAKDAKVTLYPVVKTYDLMICIHASHSNGNIYVSEEQQAEIVKLLKDHFKDLNILIDRVDGVSATNFAKQAVEKDYDLIIGSKSVVTTDSTTGDIVTAALLVNKTYDVDADSYVTLEVVDLNQSRRVGKVTGGSENKPYQEEAYKLLTSPIDKTIEVTFTNGTDNETITVHRAVEEEGILVTNSQSYEPTNTAITKATEGKVFNGWATTKDATEPEFASITYANVYKAAVDGKVTVYPVYKDAPDLYILLWGVNGSTTYLTEEEYNTIKDGFTAYLATNKVDTTGKEIELVYYQGKTDLFKSELTKEYVNGAMGASALSNDDYATYWTINKDFYAKVLNVTLLNTSRYVALRNGSENNELAVWFYRYLTEAKAQVTFNGEEAQTLSSYEKNTAKLPTIEEKAGLTFVGWATTADATEASIAKDVDITYTTVSSLLTDGAVTLYPVYVDTESLVTYDLIVYVLRGNSSNEYITVEEAEAAIQGFKTWLQTVKKDTNEYNFKVDATQQCAGSVFLTYVNGKGNGDVVIGASNLNPVMYTDKVGHAIINKVFSNSSRWAYIYKDCKAEHVSLAEAFIEYMCDATVAVTVNSETTTLSLLKANTLALAYTPAEGYQFDGWTTESGSTTVAINANVASISYNDVKDLTTTGAITLYPITSLIPASHTCGHVCAVCGKCTDQSCNNAVCADKCKGCTLRVAYHSYGNKTSTVYVSEEMKTTMQNALLEKMQKEGLDTSKIKIEWIAVTGKVDAADDDIKAANVDIVIGHPQLFAADKADNYVVTETGYDATVISTSIYDKYVEGETTKLKVGVVKGSGWNRLAQWLYDIAVNYTKTN